MKIHNIQNISNETSESVDFVTNSDEAYEERSETLLNHQKFNEWKKKVLSCTNKS